MQNYAQLHVYNCVKCQFSHPHYQLPRNLTSLTNSWPFAQWRMDIVGVLPQAQRNKKFLQATIDFLQAKPLAQVREVDVIKFIHYLNSCQKTKPSMWTKKLGSCTSLRLSFTIQRWPIRSIMGKLRHPEKLSWLGSRRCLKNTNKNWLKNYRAYCEPIKLHTRRQRTKRLMLWV